MKKLYKFCCIALLLLAATGASAQWQTSGPFGGAMYSSVTLAGKTFVGTGNGVYVSNDNGLSWTASNGGMARVTIVSLTTDGINLFAGGEADGVFFSSDNGTTWQVRNTGLASLFVTSLYAAANGDVYCGTANGEYYSSNKGLNWSLRNTGIPAGYSIYSHTEIGDTILAGSYITGLYQSTNSGMTWNHVSGNGFPDSTFVYALCKDNTSNKLYAGTGNGVYISANRGMSWTLSNTGIPSNAWITSLAAEPGMIFAGTPADGIYISSDNGLTWNPSNTGIAEIPHVVDTTHVFPTIQSISVNIPNVILATLDGIYVSTDNGFSWSESDAGVTGIDVNSIATTGSTVVIGTARNGIFISSDNGSTWNRSSVGITSQNINSVMADGSTIYASAGYQLVFRSTDGGLSWTHASSGITSEVIELRSDSSRVLALTNGAPAAAVGLFATSDTGNTWTEIPTAFPELMSTLSCAGSRIYVGTWNGAIYYTNNSGGSWNNVGSTLPNVKINSILIDGTTLYAGTDGSGIYKSTDNGTTWNIMNTGLSNLYVNDMQLKDDVIYTATWGGGIFVSNDGGASWSTYNSGLGDLHVRKINTDAPTTLYAATDAGAYHSPLMVLGIPQYELAGVNVYPNPAVDQLHIALPDNSKVVITLYNMAGDVIYSYEGNNSDNYNIDLSGNAKGVYLLDLQTANGVAKKKIVLQ